jgi:predicted O-linked N-acetylglucosamine transferase (SPINDLY family)
MDYRLVDPITDPVGEAEEFHSELLCRFAPTAWSYAPPDAAPEPSGLPAGPGVTFGCFNNVAKVSDASLRCWSQLLAAVPQSRLLLKWHGLSVPAVADRVRARLAAFGCRPDQVELLERSPSLASHLALYGQVDVALDTYPYNGTTTTCEALWMGVPVVTLRGDRHSSRVGASLLTAAGHPEWIAASPAEYGQVAAGLAADRPGRARWRTALRTELRQGPLGDHAGQAARFGAALRGFWSQWCADRVAAAAADRPICFNPVSAQPIKRLVHDLRPVTA